jgi:undecaprenyl diphosphate synthase
MKLKVIPKHVALVLDGNGRWAQSRGLNRSYGHYRGGYNIFTIAKDAKQLGIQMLTVFAFSTENWKRPQDEIDYLMSKPIEIFEDKKDEIDYKIQFIGRRDRIPEGMKKLIHDVETRSKAYDDTFILYVALDYGGIEEIIQTMNQFDISDETSFKKHLMLPHDVDLLIRTGGELRLSNFLLVQLAYAELYFTKTQWPAFHKKHLVKALKSYQQRQRKFGGLL